MRKSTAFTLIELLIVIAIIGILMSLLFPAVNSAIDAARKAQAKNDVTQIATAVIAYETEYGKLPTNPTTDDTITAKADAGGVISILGNLNTETGNPRQIVFIETQPAKKGKSGISNNLYVDPWGGTYQIKLDGTYDNTFSNVSVPSLSSDSGTETPTVKRKVMVWSTNSSFRKRVRSWE